MHAVYILEVFGLSSQESYPNYVAKFGVDDYGRVYSFEITPHINAAIEFYGTDQKQEAYALICEMKRITPSLDFQLKSIYPTEAYEE